MSCGCDCGSIMARPAVAPVSPLEIVAADDIVAGWDAAVRVDTAGAVSVLPDVSGNGFNLTQAVGANQPTAVVGGGPNGNDSILFDGVDDFMVNAALDLPAPGTTPTTYWAVFRQVTWTSTDVFWSANGGLVFTQDNIGTPSVGLFNGAFMTNPSMTLNTFMIVEVTMLDSPSDAIRVNGTITTGVSAGNIDPGIGFGLGFNFASTVNFANLELCELWLFRTALTIQQRSQLRAYATNRYGPIP